jgi:hypothetical protein
VLAIVDATWVPWPTESAGLGSSEKFCAATTWPVRSGCVASMPLSTTATLTPSPVYPACHAAGAPIRGTLRSRFSLYLPSSQTLPPVKEPLAIRCHTVVAWFLLTRAATAPAFARRVGRTLRPCTDWTAPRSP